PAGPAGRYARARLVAGRRRFRRANTGTQRGKLLASAARAGARARAGPRQPPRVPAAPLGAAEAGGRMRTMKQTTNPVHLWGLLRRLTIQESCPPDAQPAASLTPAS